MGLFKVGDIVHLTDRSGFARHFLTHTYEITKVPVGRAGVNYQAKVIGGANPDSPYTGRGVKAPESCFLAGRYSPTTVAAVPYAYEAPIANGTLVTFKDHPGYWVVCAATARGSRIFSFGGSSRYYTGVRKAALTVVDGSRVSIAAA